MGIVRSPFDYRDAIASAAMAETLASMTLPASLHTDLGSVLDQNIEPACASHMAVELLRLHWFKKTGDWIDFSPRFIDTLAKRFDGQDRATGGTYLRLCFQLMVQYGCATTATLPNDTSLPTLQYRDDTLLTPAVFAEALNYTIPGYFAVPMDKQSTRATLTLYGAIGAAMEIGPEWYLPSFADKDIDPLKVPSRIVGDHAITPNGFTLATDLNDLRNHWGTGWANDGENRYSPTDYAPHTFEQWAIAEIPQDIATFLKFLPAPGNFHYEWNTNLTLGMEVVGAIDFAGKNGNVGRYATDPQYTESINITCAQISMAVGFTGGESDESLFGAYLEKVAPTSPVTASMIYTAAKANGIDFLVLTAVLQHESNFGTLGAGSHTNNPGNVGNVDSGATHTFASWQEGINACAVQLARRQLPSKSDDVKCLQVAYMILGLLAPVSLAEFGIFGPRTAVANAAFQKSKRITPSQNNVGPLTRAALNAEFAVKMLG